jgi:hypothetical protein
VWSATHRIDVTWGFAEIRGAGGLDPAGVPLSVTASAKRHGLKPWSDLRDVLDQLAARSATDELNALLPDAHAAAAHLAQDLVIPQLLQGHRGGRAWGRTPCRKASTNLSAIWPNGSAHGSLSLIPRSPQCLRAHRYCRA